MTCIMLNPLQSIVLTQLLTDALTLSVNVLQGLEVSHSELGTLLLQMLPACGGWGTVSFPAVVLTRVVCGALQVCLCREILPPVHPDLE